MKPAKINIIPKLITFIIALQILNSSIAAPSSRLHVSHVPHKCCYIENYVEFVRQIILPFTNQIPKTKDKQQKELQHHKRLQKICKNPEVAYIIYYEKPKQVHGVSSETRLYQFIKEINPPPPKLI